MTTLSILHVDDDPMQQLLLSEQIRALLPEAQLTAVVGVYPALHHLEQLSGSGSSLPDIIICDVNMPNLKGWVLVSELRSDARFAQIPVIMATTEVSVDPTSTFQSLAREHGITSAVKKPVQTGPLKSALRVVFPNLFLPVNFLVLHDESKAALKGPLQDIRGWLENVLRYPRPLTTNRAEGAITLLDAGLGIDAIIVGMVGSDLESEPNPEALYAFLRQVRESEDRRDMPVIVIADPMDTALQSRAVEAGATGFIKAPLNLANFREGLRQSFGLPPHDWSKAPMATERPLYLTGMAKPWG